MGALISLMTETEVSRKDGKADLLSDSRTPVGYESFDLFSPKGRYMDIMAAKNGLKSVPTFPTFKVDNLFSNQKYSSSLRSHT